MSGGGSLFTALLNPIGYVGKAIGGPIGAMLDPAGAVVRALPKDSALRWVVNPVNAYTEMYDAKPPAPAPYQPMEVGSYEQRMADAKDRLKRQGASASTIPQAQKTPQTAQSVPTIPQPQQLMGTTGDIGSILGDEKVNKFGSPLIGGK